MESNCEIIYKDKSISISPHASLSPEFIGGAFGIEPEDIGGLMTQNGEIIPLQHPDMLQLLKRFPTFVLQIHKTKWLNLSGGTGGKSNEREYFAPEETKVISSAPVFNNQNFFYMGYLFDSQSPLSTAHNSYWLTKSSGEQTLDFHFSRPYDIVSVSVCATTYAANTATNRRSNYRIYVFKDNEWIPVSELINTLNDHLGLVRDHDIRQTVGSLRICLTQESEHGVCLKKIKFLVNK